MEKDKDNFFVANCAAGMEDLVAAELKRFGAENPVCSPGVVSFQAPLEVAYRACLWSRFASRILMLITKDEIKDTDQLYDLSHGVNWSDHLHSSMTFSISTTFGKNPIIQHSHYCSLRVKDGVVDYFREKEQKRPSVEKNRSDVRFHLHLDGKEASLYVDLSGDGLHKRGYRSTTGIAPLKENLAAAIVTLAGWSSEEESSLTFLDPMCGSGTLLIEAALIWSESAPGLSRKYYGFSKWLGHCDKTWDGLVDQAITMEEEGWERDWPRFIGYDSDPEMVAVAKENIENAGLTGKIEIKKKEVAHLQSPSKKGYIVSNLPYGERLSEKADVGYLYGGVGRILRDNFQGWKAAIFVSEPDLADKLALTGSRSFKLYNGPIPCRLYVGDVKEDAQARWSWDLKKKPEDGDGLDFANRLAKNYKKFSSWSKKNNISCYRIYDRDLPEYNVTIDLYERWILVQEYVPPKSIDEEVAKKRASLVLHRVREVFQVGRERVFIRRRDRQRGKKQYEKKEKRQKFHTVREGGCSFLVNFSTYLDTGLFLDHRPVRMKIAELAKGKRFLNLFGYTGTATVHAAKGGAVSTTTVDLSANYLDWCGKNLMLNGIDPQYHKRICQDCLSWLRENKGKGKYDLIFIDPPTFSNTKKKNLLFDVQRNHGELLSLASTLLTEEGIIIFSTNYRGFKLDESLAVSFDIENISKETIPFDFMRNKSIHKCWAMKRKE